MRRASVQTIDVTEEFIDAFKRKKNLETIQEYSLHF